MLATSRGASSTDGGSPYAAVIIGSGIERQGVEVYCDGACVRWRW
jgi:hypothetical protein